MVLYKILDKFITWFVTIFIGLPIMLIIIISLVLYTVIKGLFLEIFYYIGDSYLAIEQLWWFSETKIKKRTQQIKIIWVNFIAILKIRKL